MSATHCANTFGVAAIAEVLVDVAAAEGHGASATGTSYL